MMFFETLIGIYSVKSSIVDSSRLFVLSLYSFSIAVNVLHHFSGALTPMLMYGQRNW